VRPKPNTVAAYLAAQRGMGRPAYFVSKEKALDMVSDGSAFWNTKKTFINLAKTDADMIRADRSLTMGPSVIHGCAEGNFRDLAILESWKPRAA
jgi:hypothetical protein